MDRQHISCALAYATLGLVLGIFMAASHDHGQMVTHAHIMLLGFVLSFIYGVMHRLWLHNSRGALAILQFCLHQIGSLVLLVSLFLMYGKILDAQLLEPLLALSSITVLVGLILMIVLFLKNAPAQSAQHTEN
ncbi:TonB-dependent receptor [Marinobacterium rhizophilum]|uniref:TonB-dependent receptor n=1 Tax=Marinobacterium rhizophilum TaxID=420402 RepID=A0ABY5HL17_9GAMM|nr:TonB-dependent receptor [Marinobacterium rhizophilum]UTW11646.1 TonB-dependent receptor [Marinobacterium rhizophilum]